MRVCARSVSIRVSICVCVRRIKKRTCKHIVSLCVCPCAYLKARQCEMVYNVCTCVYVCVCVFAAGSGDICCVVGWEQSTAGSRSLRARR